MAGFVILWSWLVFGLYAISASHFESGFYSPNKDGKYLIPPNHPGSSHFGNYENVDTSGIRVTPINENYKLKLNDRYKPRYLRTNKTTIKKLKPKKHSRLNTHRETKKKHLDFAMRSTPHTLNDRGQKEVSLNSPFDILYDQRRLLSSDAIQDTPIQWTHCEELITPYIRGMVDELTAPKNVGPTDRVVTRMLHLMNTNTTSYSKQDIYHLMYQISNLQVRLFEWEADSLRLLFNALSHGKRHSFKAIKAGLKRLFKTWHLDIGDAKNLLEQARIFRPPCIGKQIGGSTKSPTSRKYMTSAKSGETDEVTDKKIAFDGFECSDELGQRCQQAGRRRQ